MKKIYLFLSLGILLFNSGCDQSDFISTDQRNLRTEVETDEPEPVSTNDLNPTSEEIEQEAKELKPEPTEQIDLEPQPEPEPEPEPEPQPEPEPEPIPDPEPIIVPTEKKSINVEKPRIVAPRPVVNVQSVQKPIPEEPQPIVLTTITKPMPKVPAPTVTVTEAQKPQPAEDQVFVVKTIKKEPIEIPSPPRIVSPPPTISITYKTPKEPIIQEFSTETNKIQIPVDLLFVIDNSESMNDEVERVYNNLQEFLKKLSVYSKTKVAILTAFDQQGGIITFNNNGTYNTHPPLYSDSVNIAKIDRRIRSYNGLAIISDFIRNVLTSEQGITISTQGEDFFRDESLKVIVMVTDDDALDLSARSFIEEIYQYISVENLRFFSFVGIPQQLANQSQPLPFVHFASLSEQQKNCSIFNEGNEYFDLANNYIKGAIFDLCLDDWSQHFETIADYVVTSVRSRYQLSEDFVKIIKVTINDQKISPDNFILTNESIQFSSEVLPSDANESKTVRVYYQDK